MYIHEYLSWDDVDGGGGDGDDEEDDDDDDTDDVSFRALDYPVMSP